LSKQVAEACQLETSIGEAIKWAHRISFVYH
jgi:hypothetical protein